MVAIRCQAVVGRREGGFHRLATGGYERRVATSDRWLRAMGNGSHPLPSGGRRGERGFHRLATGGYGSRIIY